MKLTPFNLYRNSCDAEEDGPGSLVGKETLDAAAALSVTRDEEEELERMFEQVRVSNAKKNEERLPKIMLSPREESVTRPLRDKGPCTCDVRRNTSILISSLCSSQHFIKVCSLGKSCR